jgi:hypothetical protein
MPESAGLLADWVVGMLIAEVAKVNRVVLQKQQQRLMESGHNNFFDPGRFIDREWI